MFPERLSIQNTLYSGFSEKHQRLQRATRKTESVVPRVKTYGQIVKEKCCRQSACALCSYYLSNNLATGECQECHHWERC